MAETPPEWIEKANPRRARGWDDWTDEIKATVAEAIEWRGKGYLVSAQQVAECIEKLGGHATKDMVNRYCREVLGRKSLANP